MTRKDYVAIAQAFQTAQTAMENSRCIESPASALAEVAFRIALAMKQDNARFDRARFLKACGVQS